MGDFRIEINAVGGHGCRRDVKDGEVNYGCGYMSCPDCQAREFVAQLKRKNIDVRSATLRHWPDTESEVVDDLVTGVRKGKF